MNKTLLFILPAILLFNRAAAQQEEKPVEFANGKFSTNANINNNKFSKESLKAAVYNNDYYVLLQFNELPSLKQRAELKKAGIRLGGYMPGNAYYATISGNFDFAKAKGFNVASINAIPAAYKIDQQLKIFTRASDTSKSQLFAVSFFETVNRQTVVDAIRQAGGILNETKLNTGNIILIETNPAIIDRIAQLSFVYSISLQYIKDQPLNNNSRAISGVSAISAPLGKNLHGKNVTVGVGDNADISTHIDFSGRLINRSPWIPDVHGTHTSGTTAGGGIIKEKYQGLAPKATIVSQFFSDIVTNADAYLTDYNMVLTNNSYHSALTGCNGNGKYDVMSNFADNQLYNNSTLLHVFASGNDGNYTCSPFPLGYATVKSGWQVAKNVLTVGAINAQSRPYAAPGFSSRGPAADGRIKPEIVSHGVNVFSDYPNNEYGNGSGTSMAAPGVTGTLTLLYEHYRKLHAGADPKSALIKAIACNTAEDLGNAGPDYTYGFGAINGRRAVEALDSSRYYINTVAHLANSSTNITIPAGVRRLKILLYWHDVAASVNAASALVNDLDMVVIEPNFSLHRALSPNPASGSVSAVATEKPDHLNNIEQVIIENPSAGNYTINVIGYNIPSGSQEYVVSYEILKPSVTVEYPYGGEKLVPDETETIRWTAYGNETNTFNIEYSVDNGSNWITINSNVAANTMSYDWVVPANLTSRALVRVSRNGTALSGVSKYNFTILSQPVLTVTNACEGAVTMKWNTVSGADSYDVFKLNGDSMELVANTTDTSYLLMGLHPGDTSWLGVAAKIGSATGRRSISIKAAPNAGPCTLAAFNNDLKVDTILEPVTARQLFSNAANATRPVKIVVKNLGSITASGPFDVTYTYGAGSITETVNSSISAGDSLVYTFAGTYPKPTAGYEYNFKAWVTKTADNNHLNDTAYKTVKYINNDAIAVLPFNEDFETMPTTEFKTPEMAIGGNKHLDFTSSTNRGRARAFVNTGIAFEGNRALTLDQFPADETNNTDSAILNYNLSLFNSSQLRFDFYYRNHGQANAAGNKIWLRGSEHDNWVQAYDLFSNQAALGAWKKGVININDVLASANPAQNITSTFQFKIGEEGNTSVNAINPLIDIDDGYTFDNLKLSEALNDLAMLAINSPSLPGCELTANNPISVKIKNYHNAALNNVQVSYRVNNGSVVTETVPSIAANQTLDYVFNQKADLSAFIDYNINVWVKYAGDNYATNDSILDFVIHNSPIVNTYPYWESFEADNGNYYSQGTNNTWQWGAPVKTLISKASNGAKAWVTNLAGTYNNNETSYLVSPCFDLTGLQNPVLSFSHIYDVELNYDYTWVEYSLDGKNWQKLGHKDEGTNWYDDTQNKWVNSQTHWHVASIDIPVKDVTVRFRFVMSSDGGVTQEGVGIDDIRVHEKSIIAGSPTPITPVISNGPWTNNWVPFTISGQYIVGEINAHGQNLGTVTIEQYLNPGGADRYSNNQYYLDKNFVINASNIPTGPVDVRLYFSAAQVDSLINATGCATCAKPADAYELGTTKYKGSAPEEDGSLDNNVTGAYQFVTPANTLILPHGNGYYAEFTINSFGENWFAKGDITPAAYGTCIGNTFVFNAAAGASTYQWQVNTGSGYTNISNGTNYAGATTNTLQLLGATVSFSGNQYRCLVNGTAGGEFTLRFKNIWTGAADTNWFNTANWSCGSIPDQYTDVIIPSGLSNYPVLTAGTAVKSIRLQAAVSFIINSGVNLDVKGN